MTEIIIKIKVPAKFKEKKDKIENLINKKAIEIIKKLETLDKAKGCLKTDKTWQELDAEIYEDVYR